jgi:hypothetical protein
MICSFVLKNLFTSGYFIVSCTLFSSLCISVLSHCTWSPTTSIAVTTIIPALQFHWLMYEPHIQRMLGLIPTITSTLQSIFFHPILNSRLKQGLIWNYWYASSNQCSAALTYNGNMRILQSLFILNILVELQILLKHFVINSSQIASTLHFEDTWFKSQMRLPIISKVYLVSCL